MGNSRWFLRSEVWLLLVALASGILFFTSLDNLWPLVPVPLHVSKPTLERTARAYLEQQGVSTYGFFAETGFSVDDNLLEYIERRYGRDRAGAMVREGFPVITYPVVFKQTGERETRNITLLPNGQVRIWRRSIQDDEPGARLIPNDARVIALRALSENLGTTLAGWEEISVSERSYSDRKDHTFLFERVLDDTGDRSLWLRERASIRVSGNQVTSFIRVPVLPPRAQEILRQQGAPRRGLELVGYILLGGSAFGAYLVFLLRLRDGSARLRRALIWSGAVFLCTLGAALLQPVPRDPLSPNYITFLQSLVGNLQSSVWVIIALLAIISAADATDRKMGANRGDTLWMLTQGQIFNRQVSTSVLRGFLVGMTCGGAMAAMVLLLEKTGIARVELQPRGFFITALNATSPSLWTLLYFLHVALLEELGYRYFAGSWLLAATKRPWVAILLPAIVYGVTHTGLPFLPPDDPFWARPLVMTVVGCIWGWAFLRFDALTVVVSHLTADLFIFNWPQLASGSPSIVWTAVFVVLLPLLPTLGLLRPMKSVREIKFPTPAGIPSDQSESQR